jgi:hypothetical protein
MKEFIYDQSGALILAGLTAALLVLLELGFRTGRRARGKASVAVRAQTDAVLASMLGLSALLLGFTFALALQRFDDRSKSAVAEANAIGSTMLRIQLLPAELRTGAQALLNQYLDLRVREGAVTLADSSERSALLRQADQVSGRMWELAMRAAKADPGPVTSGLFIQALNDMIDASETKRSALDRHVPEIVLYMMFATVLLTGATMGYASGINGHRPKVPALALALMIVLVVSLIIDLDRPRRGLINVSEESLLRLQRATGGAPPGALQPGAPLPANKASGS